MAWVRPGLQRGYNFVPYFPLTKKLDVNGENQHPIFTHLKVGVVKKDEYLNIKQISKIIIEIRPN